MTLVFVDVEAHGPCPRVGVMTEFGAVLWPSKRAFHGVIFNSDGRPLSDRAVVEPSTDELTAVGGELYAVVVALDNWLAERCIRPVFVSDNPAFDWQWINDAFHTTIGRNPFGHSARRISDFWAGLRRDFRDTQAWKKYRVTTHDHHPVHDALGNLEAFARLCREHDVRPD